MKEKEWSLYELLDRWFDYKANDEVRPIRQVTKKSYSIEVCRTKKWFDDMPVSEITSELIQKAFNAAAENGSARSTINHVKIILGGAFKYMDSLSDTAIKNPVTRTILPANASVKDVFPLTKSQQLAIEKACLEDRYGYLHLFLLMTGLRRQELCNLKWADYDDSRQFIKIRESKTRSGIRTVPLLPFCDDIIKKQPKINEYIFNQENGNPINPAALRATYMRIRKVTGIKDLTNHVCRHTFATRLLETGAKEKAISVLLGHSSVAFTLDRYVKAQPEYLRSQIMLIDSNPLEPKQNL